MHALCTLFAACGGRAHSVAALLLQRISSLSMCAYVCVCAVYLQPCSRLRMTTLLVLVVTMASVRGGQMPCLLCQCQ
jgi:hypothetical protein